MIPVIPLWFVVLVAIVIVVWYFNAYIKPKDERWTRAVNIVGLVLIVWLLLSVLRPASIWFPFGLTLR